MLFRSDNFDMYLANEDRATLDPQFLNDMYHSANVATDKNILNFQGKYMVDNYSIINQIVDNTTWTAQLEHSNLVGDFMLFRNETIVPTTEYQVDMKTGLVTLNTTFVVDYLNDTLNVTYGYLGFDDKIDKANKQMDPVMRAKYVKEAQNVINDMVPSVPLFAYKVSHAYKTNVYVGWVQTLGGVVNYWTFTNLKNPVVDDTTVTLSGVKNFLNDGETMNLFVKVQDLSGGPVEATKLVLTGEGTFGTPAFDSGSGQYTISYIAPATTSSRTITLKAEAYTLGYGSSSDTMELTIHPLLKNFNVDITRGNTSLPSGETTSISVLVKDKATNVAISGANVVLVITPAGLGGYLETVTGTTNAAGEFVTTFGSANVTIDTTFRITAYITKAGYVDSEQTTSISVSRDPTISVSTDNGFLGLPGPSFLTIILLMSGMAVAFTVYRRKRN